MRLCVSKNHPDGFVLNTESPRLKTSRRSFYHFVFVCPILSNTYDLDRICKVLQCEPTSFILIISEVAVRIHREFLNAEGCENNLRITIDSAFLESEEKAIILCASALKFPRVSYFVLPPLGL